MYNFKLLSILVLVAIFLEGCIFMHPNIIFSFTQIGDVPPSGSDERLEKGGEFPQEIKINFSQTANRFTCFFIPVIFTNKLRKKLFIHEMSYKYDTGFGVFLKDKLFVLPSDFVEKNGWYYRTGVGQEFFYTNFEKVFKNKKVDDKFHFNIILNYSFDDELEKELILEYEVTAVKGEYHWPVL